VPRAIEHIMARCMEKMPANRYGSTQALIDDLVEFLATRVPINHNARLVMFLREVSVITDAEADEILEAAGSRGARQRTNDRTLLRHTTFVMSGLCVSLVLSGGLIQTVSGRFDENHPTRSVREGEPLTPENAGFVQVNADPWAQVYVDGKLVTVTPTAERIMVAPGRHFIKLVNPHFDVSAREIRVEQGQFVLVEATLTPKVVTPVPRVTP
jgi:eukaryotic-like serine/threonine-protein kinase